MMQKIYEVKIINYYMSLDVQKIKTALDQYFNSENI